MTDIRCGMNEPRAFGDYLRSERELRQIPLMEIADATKIPMHALQCIEHGEWDALPANVFVRGFVRSYARHVGLTPEEACGRYDQICTRLQRAREPAPVPVGEGAAVMGVGRRRFGLALFVLIILIITTITLSLLWRRGAGADTRGAQLDNPASVSFDLTRRTG